MFKNDKFIFKIETVRKTKMIKAKKKQKIFYKLFSCYILEKRKINLILFFVSSKKKRKITNLFKRKRFICKK